jgi:hypothetical protein
MELYPAVIVHGLKDATAALARAAAEGAPVTLLSAPGAAFHAGCGWWRAMAGAARARYPNVPCIDILDCADGTGQALAALRIGVVRLVLWPDAPGRDAVVAIAESIGGFVLPVAPPENPPVSFSRANRHAVSLAAPPNPAAPREPAPAKPSPRETQPPGNGDKSPEPG